jgi:hypothetical protein
VHCPRRSSRINSLRSHPIQHCDRQISVIQQAVKHVRVLLLFSFPNNSILIHVFILAKGDFWFSDIVFLVYVNMK